MPRWFFPVSICCLFSSSHPPTGCLSFTCGGRNLPGVLPVEQNRWQWMRATTETHQLISVRFVEKKKTKNKTNTHTHTQIKPKESEVGTSRQPPSSSATKRRKCDASGGPSGATRYTASLQRTPPDPRHTGPLSADSTRTAERFTVRSYPAATGRCVRLHARSPDQTASGGICAFRIKAE